MGLFDLISEVLLLFQNNTSGELLDDVCSVVIKLIKVVFY